MKKTSSVLSSVGAIAALTALPMQATAGPPVLSFSDEWTSGLTVYLFAPVSTEGTSTIAGQSADIDMNLSDALDVLDFTVSGRYERWKGDWGWILEGNYLGISDDSSVTLGGPIGRDLDVDVDVEQTWLSFMGGYRFGQGTTARGQNYVFDASAGVRYNYLKQDVTIRGSGPVGKVNLGGSESWFEPVIAGRATLALSDDWTMAAFVDASGFGVEDNDLAWSASLAFDRKLNSGMSVNFGYRFYSIDYDGSKSDGSFGYDVEQHGPFVGFSYRY